uniref:DOG1 domain-containing protein n=1 Tax=Nelumbo nucifera TaxID=4432 RepID=A0A822Y3S5_NELNU|nr:TPA_asm: hypothetical protein HUJ06_028688 [Nelumbo nucifera]
MKRAESQPLMKFHQGSEDDEERIEVEEEADGIDDIAERFKCMSLSKCDVSKRGEKYGQWRQEQRIRAARLEKRLKARWALEELIDEQLRRFDAHYNRAMVPSRLKEVAHHLMPKWTPPLEMASLTWLGDWRPSAILFLLRLLSSSSSSSFSGRVLSRLIHETRIEEAVLDEEMAEIQANCILHLPFIGPKANNKGTALASVQFEFKKINRVITKAQRLRYKALELVVKKLLNQTDAAQFLVAFAGIQDSVHRFATQQRLRRGPVSLTIKALGI